MLARRPAHTAHSSPPPCPRTNVRQVHQNVHHRRRHLAIGAAQQAVHSGHARGGLRRGRHRVLRQVEAGHVDGGLEGHAWVDARMKWMCQQLRQTQLRTRP